MNSATATAGRRILIADTTLRDEHLLRADPRLLADEDLADIWRSGPLGVGERVSIARQLAALGVDAIEAGFAGDPGGIETVRALAAEFAEIGPVVSVLGSAFGQREELLAASEAVSFAQHPRVHVFVRTSDLLDEQGGPRRPPLLLLDEAMGAVEAAREAGADVEFSPPWTSLEAIGTAASWAKAAVDAGVKTINLRYCPEAPEPDEFLAIIAELRRLAALPPEVVLSADVFATNTNRAEAYVEATGCAEAALDAGCRQVKCAFHGIAATPGHAALEMLAFQVWVRNYLGESRLWSNVDTKQLPEANALVVEAKGLDLPPSQPLLGEDVTAPSPESFPEDPRERALIATTTRIVLAGLGIPIPAWLDEYADPSTP